MHFPHIVSWRNRNLNWSIQSSIYSCMNRNVDWNGNLLIAHRRSLPRVYSQRVCTHVSIYTVLLCQSVYWLHDGHIIPLQLHVRNLGFGEVCPCQGLIESSSNCVASDGLAHVEVLVFSEVCKSLICIVPLAVFFSDHLHPCVIVSWQRAERKSSDTNTCHNPTYLLCFTLEVWENVCLPEDIFTAHVQMGMKGFV